MASPAPLENRCGAKLKTIDGFCTRRPMKEATRCRLHGGKNQTERPKNIVHGRSAGRRYARVSEEAQQAIDDAMQDPDLLDVRQGVAVMRVVLNDQPLLPSDDDIKEIARAQNMRQLQGITIESREVLEDLCEPTEAQMTLARLRYGEESTRIVERFSRRQVDAMKQVEAGRLLRESVVPMFNEMGIRLGRLVDQYVPEEYRGRFRDGFRQECRQVLADLMSLRNT